MKPTANSPDLSQDEEHQTDSEGPEDGMMDKEIIEHPKPKKRKNQCLFFRNEESKALYFPP